MKPKRKPIRAWAVVCPEEKVSPTVFWCHRGALDERWEADNNNACGPHRIVELVEKPCKRRK